MMPWPTSQARGRGGRARRRAWSGSLQGSRASGAAGEACWRVRCGCIAAPVETARDSVEPCLSCHRTGQSRPPPAAQRPQTRISFSCSSSRPSIFASRRHWHAPTPRLRLQVYKTSGSTTQHRETRPHCGSSQRSRRTHLDAKNTHHGTGNKADGDKAVEDRLKSEVQQTLDIGGGTRHPLAVLQPAMSGGSTLEHIDAVDAFARTLFLRAKQYPSSSLSDVAGAVRQLHLALRHLRVEAADPDSLINSGAASSVYACQVQPIVDDCDLALKQLVTILDEYDACGGRKVDGLADRVAAVRSRLTNKTTSVDMFLDAVQLHHPAHPPPGNAVQGNEAGLEGIKDKVDNIAARLFTGRDSTALTDDDDDRRWKAFKSELEKEGFSPQVLRQHKEVLRAYIRELESVSTLNGGAPPTVRGLLEQAQAAVPPPVPPKVPMCPSMDEGKCFVGMKGEGPMPGDALIPPPRQNENHYFCPDDGAAEVGDSMALISTKDLMAMDSLNSALAVMHLRSPGRNQGASPRSSQKCLTTAVAGTSSPGSEAELSSSANSQLMLGSSPSYVHTLPPWSGVGSQAPPYGTSPRSMPSRLAPDRFGKQIPLEAHWTKIRRTLVSPEVLERAGVRYEARPEYVAVLGRLTREQIADYARQSADCRAARSGRHVPHRKHDKHQRDRADSKSSREEDDDDSVLWDESDATGCDDDKTSKKGTKSYPYIVSPPSKDKASPASTIMPKSILKNKNENRVRFDPEPYEMGSRSPRSFRDGRDGRGDHLPKRHRDHQGKESSGRSRDGYRRDGERYSGERDRHAVDRHRGYDGDHHRSYHRGDHKEERTMKKKAWGETLGAVGIGGAAASLLGVLAEAAVNM
ncbi:Uncharacterized protein TCAP_03803 [Tolypocladium capitatum]|uniref:DUF8035 domain-containing protein n=1 Tax=Tolypocladium capitatum TaxID=45235 RepID=A0A2K3QFE8_9HYPO|nr:Uncharacterized protein TCAP_03803 [Tolypocladium capitatum]